MSSADGSSQHVPVSRRQGFARNLRFIAAALGHESELTAHGKREINDRLIVLAGAAIARGAKDDLLDGIIDIAALVHEEDFSALVKLPIPLLGDEPSSYGPISNSDPLRTVQEFLDACRAAEASEDSGKSDEKSGATTKDILLEYQQPYQSAVSVLAAAWNFVASKYADQLPDEIANMYLGNPHLPNVPTLFTMNTGDGLILSKYLCEIIADRVVRASAGRSEGWITLSDAEALSGINRGTLSRDCNVKIETNGEDGPARRIAVASLVQYCRDRRKADVGEEEKHFLGWECTNCRTTYPKPEKCEKCMHSSFELIPDNGVILPLRNEIS